MPVFFAKQPHVWSCGSVQQNLVRVVLGLQIKLTAVTILFVVGPSKYAQSQGVSLLSCFDGKSCLQCALWRCLSAIKAAAQKQRLDFLNKPD